MMRTPGRLTAVAIGLPFAAAAVLWSGVSAVALLARTSSHHQVTYPWQGGKVSVQSGSGDLRVVEGDTNNVIVAYTDHYWRKEPSVRVQQAAGGALTVSGKCGIEVTGNCSTNFVVTVPRGAPLDLQTGDGSIHGDGLANDNVRAASGSGSVSLGWSVAPSSVTVHTGDGSVHLTVPASSGPYRVSASTGDGGKHVNVGTDPNSPRTISVETGSGSISLGYAQP